MTMYNEVPGWVKDETWKKVVVHDKDNIKGFFGPYRWLSNFHLNPVVYNGITYPSAENAYQAAKVVHEERINFTSITPAQSKNAWRDYPLLDKDAKEWDSRKNLVMLCVTRAKYTQSIELKNLLLSTGDRYLEELNWWNDRWFGVDSNTGIGENHLGKILMKIREEIK